MGSVQVNRKVQNLGAGSIWLPWLLLDLKEQERGVGYGLWMERTSRHTYKLMMTWGEEARRINMQPHTPPFFSSLAGAPHMLRARQQEICWWILPSKAGVEGWRAPWKSNGNLLAQSFFLLGLTEPQLLLLVSWERCYLPGGSTLYLPAAPFRSLPSRMGSQPQASLSSTFWKHLTSHLWESESMLSAQLLQSSVTALGRSQASSSLLWSNHAQPGAPTSLSSQQTGLKATCKFKIFQ